MTRQVLNESNRLKSVILGIFGNAVVHVVLYFGFFCNLQD